jgi:hypothetical protein
MATRVHLNKNNIKLWRDVCTGSSTCLCPWNTSLNMYWYVCRHLIGDIWRWRVGLTGSIKMVDRKSTKGIKRNYCIQQGPPMNFLNHREWKIIMAYHIDQRCNYPIENLNTRLGAKWNDLIVLGHNWNFLKFRRTLQLRCDLGKWVYMVSMKMNFLCQLCIRVYIYI